MDEGTTYVGMDVHKRTIAVSVTCPPEIDLACIFGSCFGSSRGAGGAGNVTRQSRSSGSFELRRSWSWA
jgi:hypothetical protein